MFSLIAATALLSIGAFLLVMAGHRPIGAWLKKRTESDAKKFSRWSDELSWEWSPAFALRMSLALNLGLWAMGVIVFVVSGSVVFAGVIIILGYWLPGIVFEMLRNRRLLKIEEQLPDAIDLVVATVRSGAPLDHGLKAVAQKTKMPIKREFQVIVNEHEKGGLPLEEALGRARDRLRIEGFVMICSALIINSVQGGDVLSVLEKMSHSTRELNRLKKKIMTETTEVRAQEKIIIFMTPVFAIVICLFDPVIPDILFNTIAGNVILAIVLFVQILSILWIRRIVKAAI